MAVRQWSVGLRLGALLGLLLLSGPGAAKNNEASEARLKRDITFLASDECEGRGPGTKGIDKAADYIAAEFKKASLKPGGTGGGWFQPFKISLGTNRTKEAPTLLLRGPQGQHIELQSGRDFEVMAGSGPGAVNAPLVFAGYGATAPDVNYDDYKGIDVAGKVVVLVRRVPRWDDKQLPFDGKNKDTHAGLLNKFSNAERHKAAAILLVNDASEVAGGDKLMNFTTFPGSGTIPVLHVRRSVIEPVLRSSLLSELRDLEKDIDRDLKPRSTPLKGWSARLDPQVERKTVAVKNVIGVLEGSGPLANETVVIGAHYDHLGYGPYGSLSKDKSKQEIHHGADDNGSGTTSVLELARRFAAMQGRKGRRLVFMTFSGEERGLLGSRHYCNKEPLFPLKDTIAMVNLDMVGRLPVDKAKLIVEGLGTAKDFEPLIDNLNKKFEFTLAKKKGGTGPSDHDSFYRKNIPVFFFWTGIHKDYHRPSDTSDKINVAGMRKIVDLTQEVIGHLAGDAGRPQFVAVATPFKPAPGKTPRLGIQPNYEDDKEGILIDGVAAGGPADKAGLKGGDRIVELAGKAVRNLESMVAIMAQQERGRSMAVAFIRNGKKMTVNVTPQ